MVKGHHNWICAAYPHFVCCYRSETLAQCAQLLLTSAWSFVAPLLLLFFSVILFCWKKYFKSTENLFSSFSVGKQIFFKNRKCSYLCECSEHGSTTWTTSADFSLKVLGLVVAAAFRLLAFSVEKKKKWGGGGKPRKCSHLCERSEHGVTAGTYLCCASQHPRHSLSQSCWRSRAAKGWVSFLAVCCYLFFELLFVTQVEDHALAVLFISAPNQSLLEDGPPDPAKIGCRF